MDLSLTESLNVNEIEGVTFVRLALKVVVQDDRDFVDVILLYLLHYEVRIMISVRAQTWFTNAAGVLLILPVTLTAAYCICEHNSTLHTKTSALSMPTRYKH